MDRFNSSILLSKLDDFGWSASDFARELIKIAPDDLKPSSQYISGILNGSTVKVGSDYLTLFAKLLKCSRDDFFSR